MIIRRVIVVALVLLLNCFHLCTCLKILIFAPGVTNSILMFNKRLAELLQGNGHSVTYVASFNKPLPGAKMPANMTEVISFHPDTERWLEMVNESSIILDKWVFDDLAFSDFKKLGQAHDEGSYYTCNQLLEKTFMDKLKQKKFDIILSHYYDTCPVGIAQLLHVPIIWLSGGNYIIEAIADVLYLPYPSSYVPSNFVYASDRMTFVQRFKSAFSNGFMFMFGEIRKHMQRFREEESFEEHDYFVGQNVQLRHLAASIPALMLNGDKFLDFPRPLMSSVLYLGELAQESFKQVLPHDWEAIINQGKDGAVLFSLGTVVNTTKMPSQWKTAFVNALRRFPNYQFIWKVNDKLPEAQGVENIHITQWVPQRELLGHAKVKVFITHGGYNSLLEACEAGMPLLMLPLFWDQYGNAKRAERLGIGLVLDKYTLTSDKIENALGELLRNDSYRHKAKFISNVVADQLISPEKQLLSWIGRLAKNRTGQWQHTMLAAQRLNWLQYYSLDTGFTLLSILTLIAALVWLVFLKVWFVIAKYRRGYHRHSKKRL